MAWVVFAGQTKRGEGRLSRKMFWVKLICAWRLSAGGETAPTTIHQPPFLPCVPHAMHLCPYWEEMRLAYYGLEPLGAPQ